MSTSGKDSKNHPSPCDQMSKSTSQPSPLVPPVAMSSPSLSLWSRKLALQSEELNTLLQTSTTKLQSHQQELNTLLNTCKAEITHSQKQIELTFSKRDDEVDAQLTVLRRLTQTTTDLLHTFEAKLTLLETLHTIHQKLHSHDLIFRDLEQGQKRLAIKQERMADEQGLQTNMLKDILHILGKIKTEKRVGLEAEREIQSSFEVVNDIKAVPVAGSKRQRRLLSDEEIRDDEGGGDGLEDHRFINRQYSIELLSIQEMKDTTRDSRVLAVEENGKASTGGGIGVGLGATMVERPMKRKLLSTMDVDQFSGDEL
ncbi:uncharacterized protein LAJ45_07681 [Morchella importuna]|uniref:uncharacterized protein n=1 Tax=Morchella importuna TaxID=1174673 RepID=UPI001E8D54A2|nr:uncharacterized protein LAJ45_07681 [Morchella importuna]KAH8148229.1 hypothetical protein LAJ45_07681 [Morchella importuna]